MSYIEMVVSCSQSDVSNDEKRQKKLLYENFRKKPVYIVVLSDERLEQFATESDERKSPSITYIIVALLLLFMMKR